VLCLEAKLTIKYSSSWEWHTVQNSRDSRTFTHKLFNFTIRKPWISHTWTIACIWSEEKTVVS